MVIENMLKIDPFNCNKEELLKTANELIIDFCNLNNIKLPTITINNDIKYYGYYNNKKITLNLKKSSLPTKTPGYKWSFPGYKSDLTIIGILAHEFGHYVDYNILTPKDIFLFNDIRRKEKNVTSYEPNVHESIAESVKLFITNPELLKYGRPLRYDFLKRKLTPLYDNYNWEDCFEYADKKYITAAKNWAKK